jgi:hypothetical protein
MLTLVRLQNIASLAGPTRLERLRLRNVVGHQQVPYTYTYIHPC